MKALPLVVFQLWPMFKAYMNSDIPQETTTGDGSLIFSTKP